MLRLLVSSALLASAVLPPAAAAQVAIVAVRPALPLAALPPLAQLEAIGRELQLHLEGRAPARLDEAAVRLEAIEARLAAGMVEEPGRVRAELERVRLLLGRILGRPLPPAGAAIPSYEARAEGASALLRAVAAAPSASAALFDGSRPAGSGAAAAAARGAGISSRPGMPGGRPGRAPAIDAAAPLAPAAAAGGRTELLSARLARVSDASGKVLAYEMGVADLLRQPDAGARSSLALSIARELLSALRKPDAGGASARQLGAFLRDIGEYRPENATLARFSADGQNHFRLIFERADKSRRVVMGQFLPGTARDGKPSRMSFIVMGAIEIDPAGNPSQKNPGYWREYADDGVRLDWSTVAETEEKGWGPWKHSNEISSSWLTEKSWGKDGWTVKGKEKIKTARTKEGQSWFGRAGDKVMSAPVVGPTLKFCDQVAATLYTGVIGAPQIILADLAGSDMYSLEAGGSYAKNPLVGKLMDDQGHLDRLTPGARRELYGKVADSRRRALDASLIPLAPELRRQALSAPVSAKEAVSTLRDEYGASTYGRRMIEASSDLDGWRSAAMKAGGVAAGAFENVAEGVMNPILWVTLGAGEAVAALKGSEAVVSGAVGAKAALTSMRAVHAGATVAWWGPWLLSGTDNLGRLAQLTAEGKFDKEYYEKVGTAGADFLYMFVIP